MRIFLLLGVVAAACGQAFCGGYGVQQIQQIQQKQVIRERVIVEQQQQQCPCEPAQQIQQKQIQPVEKVVEKVVVQPVVQRQYIQQVERVVVQPVVQQYAQQIIVRERAINHHPVLAALTFPVRAVARLATTPVFRTRASIRRQRDIGRDRVVIERVRH